MKIKSVKVENIKSIKHLKFFVPDNYLEVVGKNGAGKSSVLDAIMMTFMGKRHFPVDPLRHGEVNGGTVIETSNPDLTVVLNIIDGKSTITVKGKDGGSFKQSRLMEAVGDLSFDPLSLALKTHKERIDILKRMLPADYLAKMEEYDRKCSYFYNVRRDEGRKLKEMGKPEKVPEIEQADVSKLVAEKDEILRYNMQIDSKIKEREQAENKIWKIDERVASIDEQIKKLELERSSLASEKAEILEAIKDADEIPEKKSTDEIDEQLAQANETNRRYSLYQEYKRVLEKYSEQEDRVKEAESELEKYRTLKKELASSVEMPVKGLEVTDDKIFYNGVDFDGLATSERVRVAAKIGMSLNSELKTIFVRDGSLLDEDSLKELKKFVNDNNYQLIVELVGEDTECGIVIVDGEMLEDCTKETKNDSVNDGVELNTDDIDLHDDEIEIEDAVDKCSDSLFELDN